VYGREAIANQVDQHFDCNPARLHDRLGAAVARGVEQFEGASALGAAARVLSFPKISSGLGVASSTRIIA
jgi:hypothetical protein